MQTQYINNRLNSLSYKKLLGLIIFVTIMIICFVWLIIPGGFSYLDYSDFNSVYKPVSLNLLQGEGFTQHGMWVTRVPPGFPLIISLFFGIFGLFNLSFINSMAVMVLFFSAGTSIMIFLIGEHLWGRLGGFIAIIVWSTYPIALYLLRQPNSEIPFIFFLLSSTYLLIKADKSRYTCVFLLFSGILIGAAMLIRPIAIGLGELFSFYYFLLKSPKKTAILGGVIILLANLITILPWQILTYQQTSKIIPLSSLGITSMRLGFTYPVQTDNFREDFRGPQDIYEMAFSIRKASHNMSTTSDFSRLLIDQFREKPLTFIRFLGLKLITPWYGTDSGRLDNYIRYLQLPYLSIIIASIFMTIKNKLLSSNLIALFLLLLFYFWGMTLVGMPLLRYMLPIFPFLFLFTPAIVIRNGKSIA